MILHKGKMSGMHRYIALATGIMLMLVGSALSQSERPSPAAQYIYNKFDLSIPEGAKISTEEGRNLLLPLSLSNPPVSYDLLF